MNIGICKEAAAIVYEKPQIKFSGLSGEADELLYGWGCEIRGEEHDCYKILTHYGYEGYLKKDMVFITNEEYLRTRSREGRLKYVNHNAVDVLCVPKWQGRILKTLYRGSLLNVISNESIEGGFEEVLLASGERGYTQSIYLKERPDSDGYLEAQTEKERENFLKNQINSNKFKETCNEELFRKNVLITAEKYRTTAYRWGGKTPVGIDCSGLVFMSYMENGVLIYRDAKIKKGYPVHEIPLSALKEGDLLYFPGHIAIYMGGGLYIHSTGNPLSAGVAVNSLCNDHESFRADLKENLIAAGSIF